jgi:16S rRNA (cytidine1402-2'-O)-methyltransferase
LVATPIGNLGDFSPRGTDILGSVELLCCEDTRRTGVLLRHYGLRVPRLAVCNDHTEVACSRDVLDVLATGADAALVSDAGTPGVSDPGERVVRAVLDAGHPVSAVPGPSAAIMALTISGLSTSRFVFEGFLPRKGRERSSRLADIAAEVRTTIVYEAPHRIERTLVDLREALGAARMVAVTRELTKLHEEVTRGPLGEIEVGQPRGEYVVVIEGAPTDDAIADDDTVRLHLREALDRGASTRDAVATVTQATGRSKREVYDLAVALRDRETGS